MEPVLGVVLLAAGHGRRFGADKRWQCIDGKPLWHKTLMLYQPWHAHTVVAIRADEPVLARAVAATGASACPVADRGMGYSLACGIARLEDHALTAAFIALADMPWLERGTLERLAAAATRDRILVPEHVHRGGHPVCFGADFFPELRTLDGDTGARSLLQRHAPAVLRMPVDDPGVLSDVDVPADLAFMSLGFK